MRETTQNIRATAEEKQAWQQAAYEAGYVRHHNGTPRGSVSKWLRQLANQAAAK